MTDTPPHPELLALIGDRSTAFRDAVGAASDPQARVPGCPDWTLGDLVAHLGAVQRFWAVVVAMGDDSRPPSPDERGDTPRQGALLAWSAESTRLLVSALRDAAPGDPCWTWWGPSGAPMAAGAV